MRNNLQQSILSTIIFFDMFDYPLIDTEIWYFLYKPKNNYSLEEIKKVLKNELSEKISYKDNFYFLAGREEIINIRQKREKESLNKYKKAKRAAWLFSFIPFIQVVAVGNFIPAKNTKKNSDIDFFIITKKNRIWLTRFITVLLSFLLGGRPTPQNQKDKICLTFFASEDNLNFQNIAINHNDIYFHYWLATLKPLYNKNKTYEKFIKENKWIKKYLPNFAVVKLLQTSVILSEAEGSICCQHSTLITKALNTANFKLEKLTEKIQLKKMPKHLKEKANKNTEIIISDKMLKFHDKDRREYYYKKFKKNLREK